MGKHEQTALTARGLPLQDLAAAKAARRRSYEQAWKIAG